uniref:Uncharacterized protein n=1 Tax=Trichuris muris TaxID=70415 RepID=A0A5S6QMU7_TRIMR
MSCLDSSTLDYRRQLLWSGSFHQEGCRLISTEDVALLDRGAGASKGGALQNTLRTESLRCQHGLFAGFEETSKEMRRVSVQHSANAKLEERASDLKEFCPEIKFLEESGKRLSGIQLSVKSSEQLVDKLIKQAQARSERTQAALRLAEKGTHIFKQLIEQQAKTLQQRFDNERYKTGLLSGAVRFHLSDLEGRLTPESTAPCELEQAAAILDHPGCLCRPGFLLEQR